MWRFGGGGGGVGAAGVLGEPLHPEILGHGQEVVEVVLGDVDLALVHEGEDRLEVGVADALHVEEGVLVGVPPEHGAEEGAAGGEDDLVRLDLLLLARQGHVEQVLVVPQLPKGGADVGLEVIPLQAELF